MKSFPRSLTLGPSHFPRTTSSEAMLRIGLRDCPLESPIVGAFVVPPRRPSPCTPGWGPFRYRDSHIRTRNIQACKVPSTWSVLAHEELLRKLHRSVAATPVVHFYAGGRPQ